MFSLSLYIYYITDWPFSQQFATPTCSAFWTEQYWDKPWACCRISGARRAAWRLLHSSIREESRPRLQLSMGTLFARKKSSSHNFKVVSLNLLLPSRCL